MYKLQQFRAQTLREECRGIEENLELNFNKQNKRATYAEMPRLKDALELPATSRFNPEQFLGVDGKLQPLFY